MPKRLFNTKVKIEALEKKLSDNNLWISEYKPWNEVWVSISIKDISSRRTLYLFTTKWRPDFPKEFRAVVRDRIFTPTQRPATDASQGLVLFHAVEG